MVKRWTAYKMAVADIVNGKYTEDGFILFGNLQVNRVRVMGTVVSKLIGDKGNYGFLVIDDGTETMRVRCFEDQLNMIESVNFGDIVDVFGRLKEYEEEVYVIPEIVTKIDDPNWEILRKVELVKQKKQMPAETSIAEVSIVTHENNSEREEVVEEEMVESPKQKVIKIIKYFDKGDGVDVNILNKEVGDESIVESVLTDLMNEGSLFEPRPGKVKLLE